MKKKHQLRDIEAIKKLVVVALTSDDMFIGLVLKGGNALQLGYEITSRGSIDLDFSLEGDFNKTEIGKMQVHVEHLLNKYFKPEGLYAFDVKFESKPRAIRDEVADFWGGYMLSFKIIELEKASNPIADIDKIRREALVIGENQAKIFTVDISKYEFIAGAGKKDIGGAIVRIYTPDMLALEKVRALCQQVKEYKSVVGTLTLKSRARDFYDIYNLTEQFDINPHSDENVSLAKSIFEAKHVPLDFVGKLQDYREHHRSSWESVIQTISVKEELKEFDFYFDYVLEKYGGLFKAL